MLLRKRGFSKRLLTMCTTHMDRASTISFGRCCFYAKSTTLSVFDIKKDVYHGELVPIEEILKDGAPTLERPMTQAEDFHAEGIEADDKENGDHKD